MISRFNTSCFLFFICLFSTQLFAAQPILQVDLKAGHADFPRRIILKGPAVERIFVITNVSNVDMPLLQLFIPPHFVLNSVLTTCGDSLNANSSCEAALQFHPSQLGTFTGVFEVCGGNGNWCSTFPRLFEITVVAS